MNYYKGDKHIMEWENEDLELFELHIKLECAKEGHEDMEIIDMIEAEINKRASKLRSN